MMNNLYGTSLTASYNFFPCARSINIYYSLRQIRPYVVCTIGEDSVLSSTKFAIYQSDYADRIIFDIERGVERMNLLLEQMGKFRSW
jgi:hypothetical protein